MCHYNCGFEINENSSINDENVITTKK